eukprot:1160380-Pelagomonas_calceolata.AAC.2
MPVANENGTLYKAGACTTETLMQLHFEMREQCRDTQPRRKDMHMHQAGAQPKSVADKQEDDPTELKQLTSKQYKLQHIFEVQQSRLPAHNTTMHTANSGQQERLAAYILSLQMLLKCHQIKADLYVNAKFQDHALLSYTIATWSWSSK